MLFCPSRPATFEPSASIAYAYPIGFGCELLPGTSCVPVAADHMIGTGLVGASVEVVIPQSPATTSPSPLTAWARVCSYPGSIGISVSDGCASTLAPRTQLPRTQVARDRLIWGSRGPTASHGDGPGARAT